MKKIIIFIITILILGVIAMYSCIQNSKRIQDDKIKNDNNNLEIAEITDKPKEENTENNLLVENKNTETIIEQPKAIDNAEVTKKEKIQSKETSNETIKDNSNIKASKQPKSNNSNQISENVNEKKNEPNKEVKKENKVIQKDETKQQQTSDTKKEENVKKEEYKRNNQMIEKMKNIIQKNETEDMKKYGYEIVVDSSIKEMTNQFTYTEDRVKQKITWKFGTIKIYAEDYYCNGQYIMTECYII